VDWQGQRFITARTTSPTRTTAGKPAL